MQNKIYKFIEKNTLYDVNTKRLHIYNGIITSPVIKYEHEGNYRKSYTMSGSVYITVEPTYFNPKK
jgi:hypothetical protein